VAAAKLGFVDDIVVQQRRRVDHFDDRRQRAMVLAVVSACAGGQDDERGAQALSASADDVLGDLPDQWHLGAEALAQHAIDLGHFGSDQRFQGFGGHVAIRASGADSGRRVSTRCACRAGRDSAAGREL
jgi:hypothetical protein